MKWFRTEPPAVVSGTAKRMLVKNFFLTSRSYRLLYYIPPDLKYFSVKISTEVPDVNKNAVCTWCGMAKRPHIKRPHINEAGISSFPDTAVPLCPPVVDVFNIAVGVGPGNL